MKWPVVISSRHMKEMYERTPTFTTTYHWRTKNYVSASDAGRLCRWHHPRDVQVFSSVEAKGKGKTKLPGFSCLGSGAILNEVNAGPRLLKDDLGVSSDVWSVTSF